MRFSFLLASTFSFGLATASLLPRAPAPVPAPVPAPQASGIPQQCNSACPSQNGPIPNAATLTPNQATCSNAVFQTIKTCFDCLRRVDPSTYTPDAVKFLQQALDQYAAQCNQSGYTVQPITLGGSPANTSPTNSSPANGSPTNGSPANSSPTKSSALSRYQGSVNVAGAVGVVAVAGVLAL